MPHVQEIFLLAVGLSLNSVFAIPVPTHNGGGLIGGLVDDVLGLPTYTARNDQNQNQTVFFTQFVTTPTSPAEPTSQEHSTTVLLVTSTITSYVQAAVGSPATPTASSSTPTASSSTPTASSSTPTAELVPDTASTTKMHQIEPTNDTPPYHNPSMRRVKGPIVAGYYPDWASGSLSPEQVDWRTFDWVDFGASCRR